MGCRYVDMYVVVFVFIGSKKGEYFVGGFFFSCRLFREGLFLLYCWVVGWVFLGVIGDYFFRAFG